MHLLPLTQKETPIVNHDLEEDRVPDHSIVTLKELLDDPGPSGVNQLLSKHLSKPEAVVLNLIHYWIKYKSNPKHSERYGKDFRKGRMWLYKTRKQLHEEIPSYCEKTLYRALCSLRAKNLLFSANYNKFRYDRTLWYSPNYDMKLKILMSKHAPIGTLCPNGSGQGVSMDRDTMSQPIPSFTSSFKHILDESPLRDDVDSLRSSTRPHGSKASVMHITNSEVLHKPTEGSAPNTFHMEKFSVRHGYNPPGHVPELHEQKGKRLPMTTDHHSGLGDATKKQGSEERMAKAKEKLNISGKAYVAQQFWLTLVSHYGVGGLLSFTAKEAGMMKSLVKQLMEAGIPPGDFLEFTVVNWSAIRQQLTWPDNPKKFRLAERPFFQELVFNKNDIIRLWESRGSLDGPIKPTREEYVYTTVADIPKTHPNYARLVQQIEINGKAVTYIKA